jgi:hypothetical protein
LCSADLGRSLRDTTPEELDQAPLDLGEGRDWIHGDAPRFAHNVARGGGAP